MYRGETREITMNHLFSDQEPIIRTGSVLFGGFYEKILPVQVYEWLSQQSEVIVYETGIKAFHLNIESTTEVCWE